jgi:hypothetical protein
MKFRFRVKRMGDEVMNSLYEFGEGIEPEELSQWAEMVETTAKEICGDTKDDLELRAEGKDLHIRYKENKSKECLIRAIERHLNSMPILLQGVFNKLSNDIKSADQV